MKDYIPEQSSDRSFHKLDQSFEMMSRLARCLMVGLPWGQFQGCSISPMWTRSFFISLALKAVPIITFKQRRDPASAKYKWYNEHSYYRYWNDHSWCFYTINPLIFDRHGRRTSAWRGRVDTWPPGCHSTWRSALQYQQGQTSSSCWSAETPA